MTVQELINQLETMPKDAPVRLFDWRKNLGLGFGDPSSEGVYDEIDVELQQIEAPDEQEYYKNQMDEEFVPWVALSFENEDYDDWGETLEIWQRD